MFDYDNWTELIRKHHEFNLGSKNNYKTTIFSFNYKLSNKQTLYFHQKLLVKFKQAFFIYPKFDMLFTTGATF